ncbi:phosphotransferase family protein [Chelatococcus reniformis]|uniref:Acyl-CoA dehydrogenase n=1 Tax=Chelatococcus reniformis TaxID=1494448 RepID=A0A916U7C2_9HYPH|nr:phosphotransferase family protein [Chelatococcus reniformis]GGC62495.1 acyl-CoA dehydrogenase [Chelatococcus reniformis]
MTVAKQAESGATPGFDTQAVAAWLARQATELEPPLAWTRLPGGHSNLSYMIEDGNGRKAVIRRPPLGELLPKAHDMGREWKLITALGPTPVPVPRALAFCDDKAVTGAHFYVMSHVDGRPLYTAEDTERLVPEDQRVKLAHSFIDVLADLHALDPDALGLGDLGKRDSYVGRQLKTWYQSWTASIAPAKYDDPRAHTLQKFFLDNLPDQGPARVVHGDYGLHNCLTGPEHTIAAVVDWEISTLGDPLADLAYALNTWPDPERGFPVIPDSATAVTGFPLRRDLAARYAERTGRDLSLLDYYAGFNRWKTAAIVHGVYARYMEGKKSAEGVDLDLLRSRVDQNLAWAAEAIERLLARG